MVRKFISLLIKITIIIIIILTYCNLYFSNYNSDNFMKNDFVLLKNNNDINHINSIKQELNLLNMMDNNISFRYPDNLSERKAVDVVSYENIKINSYEFEKFLIKYPYNNIAFKNEELWTSVYNKNKDLNKKPKLDNFTDEYMVMEIAEKLNSIQNELSKISDDRFILRITDSFDNNHEHRAWGSLHYSGRAVDITLYDLYENRTRKEMLPLIMKLAIKEGFDFVLLHTNSHIHASVKPYNINDIIINVFHNDKHTKTIMDKGDKGWYKLTKTLKKGKYYIYFTSDDYIYDYREPNKISFKKSDNHSEVLYNIDPIILEIKKDSQYKILVNPYFLLFNVYSNKGKFDIKEIKTDSNNITENKSLDYLPNLE